MSTSLLAFLPFTHNTAGNPCVPNVFCNEPKQSEGGGPEVCGEMRQCTFKVLFWQATLKKLLLDKSQRKLSRSSATAADYGSKMFSLKSRS